MHAGLVRLAHDGTEKRAGVAAPAPVGAVVVGGLLGGTVGVAAQRRLSPQRVRGAISGLLAVVAVVLLLRS